MGKPSDSDRDDLVLSVTNDIPNLRVFALGGGFETNMTYFEADIAKSGRVNVSLSCAILCRLQIRMAFLSALNLNDPIWHTNTSFSVRQNETLYPLTIFF